MKIAFSNTDSQHVKLVPASKHLPLHQWQDELNYFAKEIDFYKKLLKMGIRNGTDNKKPYLFSLLEEFSKYEDEIFPGLQQTIDKILEEGNGQNDNVKSFHDKLIACRSQLLKIKAQVFPLFSELQIFTIW